MLRAQLRPVISSLNEEHTEDVAALLTDGFVDTISGEIPKKTVVVAALAGKLLKAGHR